MVKEALAAISDLLLSAHDMKLWGIARHSEIDRYIAHLLEDLVDVDLKGLDLALALLSFASCDLLGHLLGGLFLGLWCHGKML